MFASIFTAKLCRAWVSVSPLRWRNWNPDRLHDEFSDTQETAGTSRQALLVQDLSELTVENMMPNGS